MARAVRAIIVAVVLTLLIHVVAAAENCTCNETIQKLQKELETYKLQVLKLEAEKSKLENELQESKKWDVSTLMDKLFMYTTFSGGKQYKLLFHVGGLGGVAVYQYVGVGLGDAGEFRQYKQIAFLENVKEDQGYIRPGVVIKPIWGFNDSKEIEVKSVADLIRWENRYNSIEGLAEYYKWMFKNYITASGLNTVQFMIVFAIALVLGMVFGETKRPVNRILDAITLRRVTEFDVEKPTKKKEKKGRFIWGGKR